MHIIKITPHSFKIILSKEDLQKYGVSNVFDSKELSGNFFADIIEETNLRYGSPFAGGTIDAEFFEDKNGGGELFISRYIRKSVTYLFRTRDFENLVQLCKRLSEFFEPCGSTLFLSGKEYNLLLGFKEEDSLVLSCLAEYGNASESCRFSQWALEEHATKIIEEDAVKQIAEAF